MKIIAQNNNPKFKITLQIPVSQMCSVFILTKILFFLLIIQEYINLRKYQLYQIGGAQITWVLKLPQLSLYQIDTNALTSPQQQENISM